MAVHRLTKRYGAVTAIEDFSLDVARGEFIALLGPSGSGKSTLLMMIAGFESPTSGEIVLEGRTITESPPHRRGIGVVFQRYALFPHMTVAENVAFPLRRRLVPDQVIRKEVARALALVGLGDLGSRSPTQLSGGQQQRVALARAIVFNPPVLLMDEPLGALDRKLRQQLQIEIKILHREIGATIIFVTHDQEEALSMADRVAVLDRGRLQQLGKPRELYEAPSNAFVADFVGETNFLPVNFTVGSGEVCASIEGMDASMILPSSALVTANSRQGRLGIRPEQLRVSADGAGWPARVIETAYAGSTVTMLLEAGAHRLTARVQISAGQSVPQAGEKAVVSFEPCSGRIYDP